MATAASCALLASSAVGQVVGNVATIPSLAPATNANETLALPGFPEPMHLQILIDPVHLAPITGHAIQGLRFRRQPHARPFLGGGALWTIQMSIAATSAGLAVPSFAANQGPTPAATAAQLVLAPPSPGTNNLSAWDATNTIQVQAPSMLYSGGTLCIDIVGRPDPGQPPTEWPVDAIMLPRTSRATTSGPGCGVYGGGNWSFVEADTLMIGQTTRFSAFGAPGTLGMLLINDTAAPFVFDLGLVGAAPNCFLHLPGAVLSILTPFSAPVFPNDPTQGGLAMVAVEVPRDPAFLGAGFADQWLDLGQQPFAASPLHTWMIHGSPPGFGLCTIVAGGNALMPLTGEVLPDFAPVLQILY